MSGLAARLREETRDTHMRAERAGIMPDFLRGQIERRTYARLLRNLHGVYDALEPAMQRHALSPFIAPFVHPGLWRRDALEADAAFFGGAEWRALPLEPAAQELADRLNASGDPEVVSAHAYVRYMGDLSGGQALRGVVRRIFTLPDDHGVAFYTFPAIPDFGAFKTAFRASLDALPVTDGGDAIVAEALESFAAHERLFEQLATPR